mgnify:CR=1 FL=1
MSFILSIFIWIFLQKGKKIRENILINRIKDIKFICKNNSENLMIKYRQTFSYVIIFKYRKNLYPNKDRINRNV